MRHMEQRAQRIGHRMNGRDRRIAEGLPGERCSDAHGLARFDIIRVLTCAQQIPGQQAQAFLGKCTRDRIAQQL